MPETESFPRLRVWHLLFWTTCSGIVASRIGGSPGICTVVAVTIQGGALTVSAIVVYTCIRHSVWRRTEPGHWCALVAAWEYLDMLAVTPALVALLPTHQDYVYCLAFVGIAVVYSVGAAIGRWEWYWKLAISLHAAAGVSATAWRLTNEWGWRDATTIIRTTITPAIGMAAVLMMLSAIIIDLYRKRYRDWLHWCGLSWPLFKWYVLARAYVIPYLLPTLRQAMRFADRPV